MPGEDLGCARMRDGKALYGHAVDRVHAGPQLVLPCHVVPRAGGQPLDLGMARQMLGHVPGVQLRSAVDLSAIALDDDRYAHYWSWGPAGSCSPPPRSSSVAARCSSLVLLCSSSAVRCSSSSLVARRSPRSSSVGPGSSPAARGSCSPLVARRSSFGNLGPLLRPRLRRRRRVRRLSPPVMGSTGDEAAGSCCPPPASA